MTLFNNGSRNFTAADIQFMQRALQLAALGAGYVSPNPMVGAVVVANGKIIGEGWHRKFGGPHAEVNAINSITPGNQHLLPDSTVYVTLEPCSHWGKTPPCAKLLIESKVKRVVAATQDPFPEVAGRGITMLRNAGIETQVGLLEKESRNLNKRFFTAHTLKRPYITLKWAQTIKGLMANPDGTPLKISTPLSSIFMHRLRALNDAIFVGTNTLLTDKPSLTTRFFPGSSAIPVSFDSLRLTSFPSDQLPENLLLIPGDRPIAESMHQLYAEHNITSLLVEGGPQTLNTFLEASCFDEIRIETRNINPSSFSSNNANIQAVTAPIIPGYLHGFEKIEYEIGSSKITNFLKIT